LKTIPQGAATTVWCATSPLLNHIGGVYCEDADVAVIAADDETSPGVKRYSLEEEKAVQLWQWAEEMTGLTFDVN
jgi:malate/lactate dehydrogenase